MIPKNYAWGPPGQGGGHKPSIGSRRGSGAQLGDAEGAWLLHGHHVIDARTCCTTVAGEFGCRADAGKLLHVLEGA
jgi:hypothetical protein